MLASTERRTNLVQGSIWSLASVGLAAISGFAFWLIAARLHPGAQVGRASALFTSVLFVNYATGMGLQVAVARYAADASDDGCRAFRLAAAITTATGAAGAIVYLMAVHPAAASGLHGVGGNALFAGLVAGSSLAQLVDIRLMALRRWRLLLGRVALIGLVRLPPLTWSTSDHGTALFLIAIVPVALSGVALAPALWRLSPHRLPWRPAPSFLRRAGRFAAINYLSTIAVQAPSFVIPVVVLLHVPPVANANFYVAWSVTTVLFLVPTTVGQVLLVEAGRGAEQVEAQVKIALVLTTALMALALAASVVGAPLLVTLYGSGYRSASHLLPFLVAGGLPWAVTSICLAEVRARHDGPVTVAVTMVVAVAIVVPAALVVAGGGAPAVARAWFAGHAVAALVAAPLTLLARRRRPTVLAADGPVPVVEQVFLPLGREPL